MTEQLAPQEDEPQGDEAVPGIRRIAVLGEMLELGDDAVQAHRDVGQKCGELGIDIVLCVGGDMMKQTALYAAHHGVETVALVADNETAATYLEKVLKPGDKVLLKASRGGMLWQIAQRLHGQPVTGW
ncbi:UDP-N-acetylmuramoyl-tripeptide--D-alanyl-D-alanine ligase [Streptomyces sp. ScaeMP-6W]|uniref:glutamate ligase domain-containing protein n=1 Tax=unclassified Streptomyces TaxID=2593676 RepID=UPI00081E631E|nr:UDP-N-acetylmuramoylalanyl-D-glutamate--2,6-diaminopimelate ligase [Streptomyces sp. ScaeMP-6W]SCE34432.1 UDP-N-acetylmuramoyl-tripeptide--D-alanyl-D-alanine ligase [Streptomyces sp. ScaeMP-6W]